LLAGSVITTALSKGHSGNDAVAHKIAQESVDTYRALSSYSSSGTIVVDSAGSRRAIRFNMRLQRPDLYVIDWTDESNGDSATTEKIWSDGTGDYLQSGGLNGGPKPAPQKMSSRGMAFGAATGLSTEAPAVASAFFNEGWGNFLGVAAMLETDLQKGADEKVGDVDCNVVSYVLGSGKIQLNKRATDIRRTTFTLWIGKKDHLIHRSRMQMFADMPELKLTDQQIATRLRMQNKAVTPENIAAERAAVDANSKQTREALKAGAFVVTQTHENIQVNQKFSPADFQF
jgi:hypothetical protein